jgi:hypothetical protein
MKSASEIIKPLVWADEMVLDTVGEDIEFVSKNDAIKAMEEYAQQFASQFKGTSKEKIVKDSKDKIDTLIGYLELFNSRYPQLCNELPNVIREAKEFAASLSESDKEKGESDGKLFPCPYDISCRCVMTDGCYGCETFAKYQAGETISRMSENPAEVSDRYPDTEADGIVFCGKCGKMK